MTAFRLLVTEPLDGALNMALDEALLLGRLAGAAPPTLRFFAWQPATISLGYGQPLDHRIDLAAAAALGIGLVRRPTGGSAILHEGPELELTYSVAAREGDFDGASDLLETYRWIGAALAAGINRLGVPVEMVPVQPSDPAAMPTFCFARTGSYELEVAGLKVVGSAQRRQGAGFLQHGAVMLGAAPDRLRRVFPTERDPLAGMTTLEAALGRRPSFEETMTALAEGFRTVHGLEMTPGGLAAEELELADSLVRDKYGADRWTRSGRAMTVATPHHSIPR
ncbi:MAG TPA: lipoate--protein ligase family protein [Candidatus Deferrimicrobiaceae bacterium]|nr:lipoate--protein ligase family protein [Candidatus Deferrimicrobiaceae bacterium]